MCAQSSDDRDGPQGFSEPTRWTLILQAVAGDAGEAEAAMNVLTQRYWFPLYAYARKKERGHADAEDAVQEFLLVKWVQQGWLARAVQGRGKFRNFLLTVFQQFLTDLYRRETAQKRGGGLVVALVALEDAEGAYAALEADQLPAEQVYEKAWVHEWLEIAMERVWQEGDEDTRALLEFIHEGSPQEQREALRERLGISPDALKTRVWTLRWKKVAAALREEIRQLCDGNVREMEEDWDVVCRHITGLRSATGT